MSVTVQCDIKDCKSQFEVEPDTINQLGLDSTGWLPDGWARVLIHNKETLFICNSCMPTFKKVNPLKSEVKKVTKNGIMDMVDGLFGLFSNEEESSIDATEDKRDNRFKLLDIESK